MPKCVFLLHVCLLLISPAVSIATDRPAPDIVINAENSIKYSDYLDETLIDLIRKGHFTIEVASTEPFPPHPEYVKKTNEYADKVTLGDQPGELLNYVSGRPFPNPLLGRGERAGEKIAWNIRYGFSGDSGRLNPFYWQYRNMRTGKIERELSFEASNLRFKHRTVSDPVPDLPQNSAGIFNALYLLVLKPADIRNTQLLIHRLDDDTQQEQGWLYLGNQRRVRRLPTGQNTDAFLGSDVMIEDFMGYNGRIMDMEWRYLETRDVLLPFFRHNELTLSDREADKTEFHFVDFGGAGGCFPQVKWQVRTAYLVEAKPKSSQHPLSKRLYFNRTFV